MTALTYLALASGNPSLPSIRAATAAALALVPTAGVQAVEFRIPELYDSSLNLIDPSWVHVTLYFLSTPDQPTQDALAAAFSQLVIGGGT